MMEAVSDLGILMLLLLTGMETDLRLVKKARRAAVSVSATGILVPFTLGFALGQFLPASLMPRPDQRLITSLFLGTALSVVSVKIVATVVREMNFLRRKIGTTLLASAIIDDTVGWTIIAITSGLALHGGVSAANLAQSVVGTGLFLLLSLTVGRRLVFAIIRLDERQVRQRDAGGHGDTDRHGRDVADHASPRHSHGTRRLRGGNPGWRVAPILTRHIDDQLRGLVIGLFMPVFFATAGLNADLSILQDPRLVLLTLTLIAIASVGKFGGAFLGGALVPRIGEARHCASMTALRPLCPLGAEWG
jgi:Kef-type K+ transport system membrane component KefB